jgi:multicomponent K+:H+ antiporter subunit D
MTVLAAPIQRYTDATAAQLQDRAAYARAVLGEQGGAEAVTVRPYRVPPAAAPGGSP